MVYALNFLYYMLIYIQSQQIQLHFSPIYII